MSTLFVKKKKEWKNCSSICCSSNLTRVFFFFFRKPFVAHHTLATRCGVPPTLTREIKRKMEQQSALACAQTPIRNRCSQECWLCLALIFDAAILRWSEWREQGVGNSEGGRRRRRRKTMESRLLVALSESAASQGVGWQEKWDNRTAVFLASREPPPAPPHTHIHTTWDWCHCISLSARGKGS